MNENNAYLAFSSNPYQFKVFSQPVKHFELKRGDDVRGFKQFQQEVLNTQNHLYWVGFIAYECAEIFEATFSDSRQKLIDFPSLYFTAYQQMHIQQISPSLYQNKLNLHFENLVPDQEYKNIVKQAIEYIKQGLVYEINLSRPYLIDLQNMQPFDLFWRMYSMNAASHAAYLPIKDNYSLCSLSPECFLLKQGNDISTYPIKGTRKRSLDKLLDQSHINDLLNSPKEKAEHLMVVDLERNDLGRIAEAGSVKVESFYQIEDLPFLHHAVSTISARLKPKLNIFDVLHATFPSGSITGAPKISSMNIIKKLEKYPRSAYTGCLGYIDPNGDAHFSILIRSLLINKTQGILNVGGGIVFDSDLDFELEETYLKAKSFLEI